MLLSVTVTINVTERLKTSHLWAPQNQPVVLRVFEFIWLVACLSVWRLEESRPTSSLLLLRPFEVTVFRWNRRSVQDARLRLFVFAVRAIERLVCGGWFWTAERPLGTGWFWIGSGAFFRSRIGAAPGIVGIWVGRAVHCWTMIQAIAFAFQLNEVGVVEEAV